MIEQKPGKPPINFIKPVPLKEIREASEDLGIDRAEIVSTRGRTAGSTTVEQQARISNASHWLNQVK